MVRYCHKKPVAETLSDVISRGGEREEYGEASVVRFVQIDTNVWQIAVLITDLVALILARLRDVTGH